MEASDFLWELEIWFEKKIHKPCVPKNAKQGYTISDSNFTVYFNFKILEEFKKFVFVNTTIEVNRV